MKNVLLILSLLVGFSVNAQQLAFPGAEGHGRFSTGGRGGTPYIVTNLNDSGAGSLREAVEASGPRMVTFAVSGTINLSGSLKITNPNITIAGNTAPGDGICIALGGFTIAASNVTIQHIRFRLGDNGYSVTGTNYTDADTITINPSGANVSDIIVDHCSVSWSIDENVSMFNDNGTQGNTTSNVTWSNMIVSHALSESHHSKGEHSKSVLFNYNSRNVSFLKNYVTGGKERHIRMNEGVTSEWHNNIFYGFFDAGAINVGAKLDAENNAWYESGYDLAVYSNAILKQIGTGYTTEAYNYTSADNRLFHSGNVVVAGFPPGQATPAIANGWTTEIDRGVDSGYSTLSIAAAETHILAEAGAQPRDSYDTQLMADYVAGNPAFLIDTQLEVGGYPVLNSTTALTDTDDDAMPDSYEISTFGDLLTDGATIAGNGYSNLENYIHQISGAVAVDVTSVTITEPDTTLNIPEEQTFTFTVLPSNATNQTVTWSSDDTNIFTVNSITGAVTPDGVGSANLRADANGDGAATIFDTILITVTNTSISVVGVQVTPENLTVTTSTPIQFNVDYEGTGGSEPTDQTGVWSSSDPLVATIDQSGVFQIVDDGVTTVNHISNDGSFGDPTIVTVSLPAGASATGVIASSLADVKEDLVDGTIYNSTIELGNDIGGNGLQNAFHFTGANVPAGQTIQSAFIRFLASDIANSTGTVTLEIYIELIANPQAYTLDNANVTGRTLSTTKVVWNPEDWAVNGQIYSTPDISALIQEAVDLVGYSSTDAFNIHIKDITGTNTRVGVSYDSDDTNSPLLEITYGSISTAIDSIVFTEGNDQVTVKDTDNGSLTVEFTPGTPTDITGVWSSTDSGKMTVDQSGNWAAVPGQTGIVTITFTPNDQVNSLTSSKIFNLVPTKYIKSSSIKLLIGL